MVEGAMIEGAIDMPGVRTFQGEDTMSARADRGGLPDIPVALGDDATEGGIVVRVRSAFGDVIAAHATPRGGRVLSVGADPIREPGALLSRLPRDTL